jgi:hypothetical protein
MQATSLSLVLLLVGVTGALADDMKMPVNASQLEWAPAPNFVPEGAEIAVLYGDPSKDGPYAVRLKMPAGYKVQAHNHPTTEMVTVISCDFHLGMGDKLDEQKSVLLTTGGYAEAPAQMNHYAWASSPTSPVGCSGGTRSLILSPCGANHQPAAIISYVTLSIFSPK